MTAHGGVSVSHDARGNVSAIGSASYGYDSENRLTSAPSSVAFAYDPLGRLYYSTGNPQLTRFAYDGGSLIAEYDSSMGLLRRYVNGPGIDEPLVWYEGTGTGTRRYFHADERGSVIAVSDGSGNLVGSTPNRYDEYGVPQGTLTGRFGYTGQMWLPEVGLYHYRARAYNPAMGRFMQTDPIGYGGGMNIYAYVGNNPVNWIDPSGLYDQEVIVTANTRFRPQNAPALHFGNFPYIAGLAYQEPDFIHKHFMENHEECDSSNPENCSIAVLGPPRTVIGTGRPNILLAQVDIRYNHCITTGHMCAQVFPNTPLDRRRCSDIQRLCQRIRSTANENNYDGKSAGTELCVHSSDNRTTICVTIFPSGRGGWGVGIVTVPEIRIRTGR